MGWHTSSNEYSTLETVRANVKSYTDGKFPLEGVWLDIPYMDSDADFSVNATTFPDLKSYTETLHQDGKKMVVMLTPGLSNGIEGNEYVSMANQANALLQEMNTTDPFEAPLIADRTVFLDWFTDAVNATWQLGLQRLFQKVPFDGLWLSYNEPYIPCDGGRPHCRSLSSSAQPEE